MFLLEICVLVLTKAQFLCEEIHISMCGGFMLGARVGSAGHKLHAK